MSVNFNNLSNPNQTQPIASTNVTPSSRVPSGLSGVPSQLERSPREQVYEFGPLSCLSVLLEKCLSCLRRLFPCFFSPAVTIQEPVGPLSTAILEERITRGKDFLRNQLRTRIADTSHYRDEFCTRGLDPSLINDSKAIVILKYNDQVEVCHQRLQGTDSLELLKQTALNKIETLLRYPANREVHRATLSVSTLAYHFQRTISRGPNQGLMFSANSEQEKSVRFNPDDSIGVPHGGADGNTTGLSREQIMTHLRNTITSAPLIHTQLENFLFN